MSTDAVALSADLIRCPSVTPEEGGALVLLQSVLSGAGFHCVRVDRNGTPNLFARWGAKGGCAQFWVQRSYRCRAGGRCAGVAP